MLNIFTHILFIEELQKLSAERLLLEAVSDDELAGVAYVLLERNTPRLDDVLSKAGKHRLSRECGKRGDVRPELVVEFQELRVSPVDPDVALLEVCVVCDEVDDVLCVRAAFCRGRDGHLKNQRLRHLCVFASAAFKGGVKPR